MLKNQQIVVLARKRKSKIWRVRSHPNRAQVHARKEKARFGVCGAIPTGHRHTPEKKKQDLACAEHPPPPTGHKYTPKKKKQDLACAEQSPTGHRHTPEKKKQDLTCAEPSQTPSQRLQDEFFCKSVNLTQNYLLYKQAEA